MKSIFATAGIFAALATVLPLAGYAAVITVSSSSIILDTEGQSVNAIEAHLTFPSQDFAVQNMNDAGSVIGIWIVPPTAGTGTLDLSGVIPGGITTHNGVIAHFAAVPQSGTANAAVSFSVASARVLLNDGKGTPAALTMKTPAFTITPSVAASTSFAATTNLSAPDPFVPQIATSSDLFSGKYFLAFAATDQGSGIDHYEVMEVPTGGGALEGWHAAVSPHLLEDQSLSSNIYVRAVNRAGNFRVVEVPAEHPRVGLGTAPGSFGVGTFGTVAAVLLGILLTSVLLWRKKRLLQ